MAVELTVVGSINLDLVARVERLPRAGETLVGHDFVRVPGGKGANQAVAAARLGARVRMVGAVGDDPLADEALAGLRRRRRRARARRRAGTTGIALILVDDAGENEIVVVPGANAHVPPTLAGRSGALPARGARRRRAAQPPQGATFFALNAAPARPIDARARPADREPPRARGRLAREARRGHLRRRRRRALRERHARLRARHRPASTPSTAPRRATRSRRVSSSRSSRAATASEALTRACAAGALAASRLGAQPSLPTADDVAAILAA